MMRALLIIKRNKYFWKLYATMKFKNIRIKIDYAIKELIQKHKKPLKELK